MCEDLHFMTKEKEMHYHSMILHKVKICIAAYS
jgi:hypothetical protein